MKVLMAVAVALMLAGCIEENEMVALPTLVNTASAGPLGVNMGDALNPFRVRWNAGGFGFEEHEYKGSLPFRAMRIEGTRDGGACAVQAGGDATSRDGALSNYDYLRSLLVDKYGEPHKEEPEKTVKELRSSSENPDARWFYFGTNPDKIGEIALWINKNERWPGGYQAALKYWFENSGECRKARLGEL